MGAAGNVFSAFMEPERKNAVPRGEKLKKIVLTGGGTAGHVTPNVALLPGLRLLGYEIHYIGTRSGIESRLVEKEKVPFHPVFAGKLRRYIDLKNISDLFLIGAGFIQSFVLLSRLRPEVVFSKGGFVSCPVVWSAWLLGIPVVLHESDLTPGLANRLSIPFARKICYSFPETVEHLAANKAVHTGLPVRASLREGDAETGRRLCGFHGNRPTILVMGGSLGSLSINNAVRGSLPGLLRIFDVCHICGKGNLDRNISEESYRQFEYVTDELPHLFSAADLFIGRAGATTLFELLTLRKPGLLIPLPSGASRGDQILNARSFERQGFSAVLREEDLSPATLSREIEKAFSGRLKMVDAMNACRVPDGVPAVLSVITTVAG